MPLLPIDILETCLACENEEEEESIRKAKLRGIGSTIEQLQRFSTEATSYLPFYDTRRSQEVCKRHMNDQEKRRCTIFLFLFLFKFYVCICV